MPGSWGREIGGMLQGIGTEASEEGLGSKGAVVPMMMMMMMINAI